VGDGLEPPSLFLIWAVGPSLWSLALSVYATLHSLAGLVLLSSSNGPADGTTSGPSFDPIAGLRGGQPRDIACETIDPKKLPSSRSPLGGLTKCLVGRAFANARTRRLRWGIACGTIDPRKLPSSRNLSDGLTKCLVCRAFENARARLLGHLVPHATTPMGRAFANARARLLGSPKPRASL